VLLATLGGCREAPDSAPAPALPSAPSSAGAPEAAALPVPLDRAAEEPEEQPSQGKWRVARNPASAAGRSPEELSHLLATPYLKGYRPAQERPTILHDPAAAWQGLNLYVSGHAAEARLIDMEGQVLHRWAYPLRRLWPDLYTADPEIAKLEYWRRAYLFPNGDLLAIYEGLGLVKLDRRSHVLWAHRGGIHHDLEVMADGRIWALDREGRVLPRIRPGTPVLEDFVTLFAPDGTVIRRLSLLESFERSQYTSFLRHLPKKNPDLLHTNTLEVLDGRFADRDPAFRKGNLLLSVLQLDALAVVDPEQGKVVWARRGVWRRQHQPTFLDDGRLLLFDNRGAGQDRSRVIEIDPATGKILWHFGGERPADLFSKTLSSCQRLPNGNTLITESENGRALEVTREGKVVWELYNPHRAGAKGELVAVLFEVVRLPPDFPFRGDEER
jgi:outer membrane protein assembly factor BamB